MSAPYSIDLRLRILEDLDTKTQEEIAKKWRISTRTLYRWIQRKKRGKIEASSNTKRKFQKINPRILKTFVEKNPDLTIQQIADHFGVWYQAVFYRLKQLNFTYKKRLSLQRKMSRKKKKIS